MTRGKQGAIAVSRTLFGWDMSQILLDKTTSDHRPSAHRQRVLSCPFDETSLRVAVLNEDLEELVAPPKLREIGGKAFCARDCPRR